MRKIYFRADAGADIGYGHFVRSLALADMLKEHFDCYFATVDPSVWQLKEIKKVCSYLPLPAGEAHFEYFLSLLQGDEIVVLDNYFFDVNYQRQIKAKGCRLVCIDDMHDRHYVADVVINHAPCLSADVFSVEPYTQLCLGLSYALLRGPFLQKRSKIPHKGRNVFVCFGGSDYYNLTLKCVESMKQMTGISEVYAVVGNAYAHQQELLTLRSQWPCLHVYTGMGAEEMVELLRKADLAVVPASTVLWEVLSQQVPALYGYYVDNQMDICQNLATDEVLGVTCIGGFKELSKAELSGVIEQQLLFAKGRSDFSFTGDIAGNIRSVFFSDITVRPAVLEDVGRYFQWVNDPEVRKSAFHTERIDFKTHQNWFERKLSDTSAFLYVCYFKEKPVGQVRFEVEDEVAIIDISVDKTFRGRGLSVEMLKRAMNYFSAATGYREFRSEVKNENIASQKLFLKAGFKEVCSPLASSMKIYKFIDLFNISVVNLNIEC